MDNPGEAKFGMTKDRLEAFCYLEGKRAKTLGLHSFLANHHRDPSLYYPELARQPLNWLLKSRKKLGISLDFINLSGGIGK